MPRRIIPTAVLFLILTIVLASCESATGPSNRPLTDAEILEVAPPEFARLLQAIEAVAREYPSLAHDSPAFARRVLEALEDGSSASINSVENAYGLLRRLTRAELLLAARNLDKMFRMRDLANEVHAEAAARFPASTLEDGTGDAFRHAYWNVLMSLEFGSAFAEDWATAHESETPAGNRRTMDLNNNSVGRTLAFQSGGGSADAVAARIMSFPLACMSENATFAPARLLYVVDCPTIEVFDDGPDLDDVYAVSLGGADLGATPAGGGRTFELSDVRSGDHALTVLCTVDGTGGGCGFQVRLARGVTFPGGATSTPQQVVPEGGSATLTVVAPTLEATAAGDAPAVYAGPAPATGRSGRP